VTTFLLFIIAIAAYLLGAINGAIIASKYIFKKDIRNYGSHNAGLTNFYRVFGVPGVALLLAIDVLKTVFAVLIGYWLLGMCGTADVKTGYNFYAEVGLLFAGFCAMLGHSYPVYYGLRGGKGALCAGVIALSANFFLGLVCIAAFAVVLVLTRYVSLASLIGAALFPLGLWIGGFGGALPGVVGLFCFLLIAFQHRENIVRLIHHKEPKFDFKARPKRFGE